MKYFIFLFLLIGSAHAAFLEISDYDQLKLAHFLGKLPSEVVESSEIALDNGRKVRVKFEREALSMNCESSYFGEAPVPSSSKCVVEIDINAQTVEKQYDEVLIQEKNPRVSEELYAIMKGGETRYFRSGDWEVGTDFTGRRTNIFTYLFICSASECSYKFSEKLIK
jgi:hypothetical protein